MKQLIHGILKKMFANLKLLIKKNLKQIMNIGMLADVKINLTLIIVLQS